MPECFSVFLFQINLIDCLVRVFLLVYRNGGFCMKMCIYVNFMQKKVSLYRSYSSHHGYTFIPEQSVNV